MTIINTLNSLAILNSGRNPEWVDQAGVSAPNGPPLGDAGIDTKNAVVALFGVDFGAGATSADVVLWLRSGGVWGSPTNGFLEVERGLIERAMVAGCDRVYIEISATDGTVTPRVGPCLEDA